MTFYHNIGRVITARGTSAKNGGAMSEIFDKADQGIVVHDGQFVMVANDADIWQSFPCDIEYVDCKGLVAIPG
ncbi:MAG TPA: hypothetical protein VIX80_01500, partial [Candidatus Kapabacteria bacterium]